MQLSNLASLNAIISQLDGIILNTLPKVIRWEQPGYRTNNYGANATMQAVICYLICYDQKANLGFPNGVALTSTFPFLKGTGKHHRHVPITAALLQDNVTLTALLKAAYALNQI